MTKYLALPLFLICTTFFSTLQGQEVRRDFNKKKWAASWIRVPEAAKNNYGVYIFRKKITLTSVSNDLPVYVSADNRYKLFVNGKMVAMGPAKSDVSHWNYETVNLAAYLKVGENIVSAQVWNEAEFRPEFQLSFTAGFILQGGSRVTEILNTNDSWKCEKISAYQPIAISSFGENKADVGLPGWYIAGPGERIDMNQYPTGWMDISFDDTGWKNAQPLYPGTPKNTVGLDESNSWRLVPSILPQMDFIYQRFDTIRRTNNINLPTSYPKSKAKIVIPANKSVSFLIDQRVITNAFPTVIFSKGKNSTITITYAESLYKNGIKGNRNEVEGKKIIGRIDHIISNGLNDQLFTPLAYRTYRFIEIKIETQQESLVIEDLFQHLTGYPFTLKAKLFSNDQELNKMLEIGWRTARLCANETYMDCPYWEQMQYIGDTRIQALVSLYNSGDDRLVKNAITQLDNSRQTDGITLSRYPTINKQIIPTFSLWYIGMLHDYMIYGTDTAFVADKLSGSRQVMDYFSHFIGSDGSVNNLPNWFFVDWVSTWNRGMAPVGKNGSSALLDLQLLLAYRDAADLENKLGRGELASIYERKAAQLSLTIKKKYWDTSRRLFADTEDKYKFSQHTNALAILADLVTREDAKKLGRDILSSQQLAKASIYFKYYIHSALIKAGLGDDYLDWLSIWRENMTFGLSTWGEDSNVENTRSDCHGWGASPNIEFFRTILGINSTGIGFSKVLIEPHLGLIKKIGGEIPHPNGVIVVNYEIKKALLQANISLPANIEGIFIWKKKQYKLVSGKNILNVKY